MSGEHILLTADAVGGVWQYATDLAGGMVARGVEVTLAVMGPAAAPFHPAGVRVVETGLPLDWTARDEAALDDAVGALSGLAREVGASTAHLHAPALVGGSAWPVPVVAVVHSCVGSWWAAVRGGPLPRDLLWRAERTACGIRAAAQVVAPTAAFAAALRTVYGPADLRVIHNGRAAGPGRARAPGLQGPAPGHVLTAGRLWDEGKNVAMLDRAAAQVPIRAAGPVEGPGVGAVRFEHLWLLGTLGAEALAVERAAAAAFVSVPVYEPFGLAVLEAAQAGLPLVLSDIPTLRELWDGAAVFVAEEAALVAALRRVVEEPGELGERARVRAGRYTVGAMVERTLALHRSVVAEAFA